jgi:hypothetical protein
MTLFQSMFPTMKSTDAVHLDKFILPSSGSEVTLAMNLTTDNVIHIDAYPENSRRTDGQPAARYGLAWSLGACHSLTSPPEKPLDVNFGIADDVQHIHLVVAMSPPSNISYLTPKLSGAVSV